MEIVHNLASKSLVRKANTWWVGSNVKGKPQGLTMFVGGFDRYAEHCKAAAANGYAGFSFERAKEDFPA